MINTLETQDTYLGRPVAKRITFNEDGDFNSYYAANAHVKSEGHITGSMCGSEPIGFAPEDKFHYIAKWRNIDPADRKLVHGVIIQKEGFRNGPVEIIYFEDVN
jgi:hypothetical protein